MNRYKLYYEIAASKYGETLQQNRDYDLKANAMLAFGAILIGVTATVVSNAGFSTRQCIDWNVVAAITVFVIAIISATSCGFKAVSLREGRREPVLKQLREYTDDEEHDDETLYRWAGDAYSQADDHNKEAVASKAIWFKLQAVAVFAASAALLYLAVYLAVFA